MGLRIVIFVLIIIGLIALVIPEVIYKNQSESTSFGSVGNGKLLKPFLVPFAGKNFRHFSFVSYYIMDNGYTHSKVGKTIIDAYSHCEETCTGKSFQLMECSNKDGGEMLLHYTHQNGLSADFMVPTMPSSLGNSLSSQLGLWYYLLSFSAKGKLKIDKKITIDFETMGKHLLALNGMAKKNGLRIKKVIFNTGLQPLLFKSDSGRQLKSKGIYFVRALSPSTNNAHDDHYHVDFEII
ncbi:hypothetical protein ACS5NO_14155 [Larkinella sp. GY13]|uniref:hypothetical protein n=1 Tax=Larkinella sp. GY13 TaxID=3453720 RepID=UPI003EEFEE29